MVESVDPPEGDGLDKRANGIYYTQRPVADILCDWVIRSSEDIVLEPSFGGCGFLEALVSRLECYGCSAPLEHLHGCDLDPAAFRDFLVPRLGVLAEDIRRVGEPGSHEARFLFGDFLDLDPPDSPQKRFTAVAGNPPYVPHHSLTKEQKAAAAAAAARAGVELDSRASLWAHFVAHGLSFLENGGRMAWVLPSSFLYADYSKPLRQAIAEGFTRSLAVQVHERLFSDEGAAESSVILLADGWRSDTREGMRLAFANDLDGLQRVIGSWESGKIVGSVYDDRVNRVFLTDGAREWMQRLSPRAVSLSDLATVKIGIVTGANAFFIVNQEFALSNGLGPTSLRLIFSKSKAEPGIILTEERLEQARLRNERCLLVDASNLDDEPEGSPLRRYVEGYPIEKRAANVTFGKRDRWYCPDDGDIPDAFFPYMYHQGPRLIVNSAKVNATNSVHRVYLKEDDHDGALVRAVALAVASTYGQLSAEIEGRSYGAGVLKLEPSEAKRLQLLLPDVPEREVSRAFEEVDACLRAGDDEQARVLADGVVLSGMPPSDRADAERSLGEALAQARSRRWVSGRE